MIRNHRLLQHSAERFHLHRFPLDRLLQLAVIGTPNVKDPMRVFQFISLVEVKYSCVYQKTESAAGSTDIIL